MCMAPKYTDHHHHGRSGQAGDMKEIVARIVKWIAGVGIYIVVNEFAGKSCATFRFVFIFDCLTPIFQLIA